MKAWVVRNQVRVRGGAVVVGTGVLVDVRAVELHIVELARNRKEVGVELLVTGIDRVIRIVGLEPQEDLGAGRDGETGRGIGIDLQDVIGIDVRRGCQIDRDLDADGKRSDLGLDFQGGDGTRDVFREFGDDADDAGSLSEGEGRQVRHAGGRSDELEVVRGAVLGLGLRETAGETPLRDRLHVIAGGLKAVPFEGSGCRTGTVDQVEQGGLGSVGRIRDAEFVSGLPGVAHGGGFGIGVVDRVEGHAGGGVRERCLDGHDLDGRGLVDGFHFGTGGEKGDGRKCGKGDVENLSHTSALLEIFIIQFGRIHVAQRRAGIAEDVQLHVQLLDGHIWSNVCPLVRHLCFHHNYGRSNELSWLKLQTY